jgi:hypothetical protein
MFTEKKPVPKKKIYVEDIRREKSNAKVEAGKGVVLSFLPVFDKDVFDDDVVEKLKIYIINQSNITYNFTYDFMVIGESSFTVKNILYPLSDFYLHDVKFEDLSDSPRFDFEFSLMQEDKRKHFFLRHL